MPADQLPLGGAIPNLLKYDMDHLLFLKYQMNHSLFFLLQDNTF